MDHFIEGLADITTRDYLLHDSACRPLSWQEVVQMAQACEVSRLFLHAPSTFSAAASTNVDAPALAERTCTHDDHRSACVASEECTRWACEWRRALTPKKKFSFTRECIETFDPARE